MAKAIRGRDTPPGWHGRPSAGRRVPLRPAGYVFGTAWGTPMGPANLTRSWANICEELGIRNVPLHAWLSLVLTTRCPGEVVAVNYCCRRRCHDRAHPALPAAPPPGFEPGLSEPKSDVLPLHHGGS